MRTFIYITCVIILSSCAKIPLSKKYKDFNPYNEENTILVFQSNKKQTYDTVVVTNIVKAYKDGPTPILRNKQILNVYSCVPHYYANGSRLQNVSILYMQMEGKIYFTISINVKAEFYAEFEKIEFLENKQHFTDTVGGQVYNDIIVLESTSPYLLYRDNEIFKVYWSLSNGYIRLEKTDGEKFDLVKKYVTARKLCN